MASSLIHLTIAEEINKTIKVDNSLFYIGSVAPDIGKLVGISKQITHFQDPNNNDIPVLEDFKNKYEKNFNNPFVLGYYVHLYTDYLWFQVFLPHFCKDGKIYKLDGSVEIVDDDKMTEYIYNDYTNLNITLMNEYNLDLSIFYEPLPKVDNIIEEIPIDKINLLMDKITVILENSKEEKKYILDINLIDEFIKMCVDVISEDLRNYEKEQL